LQINLKVNTFARVVLFAQYKRVTYYTLLKDGENITEADAFFNAAAEWKDPDVRLKVDRLQHWIETFGDIGVQEDQLRRERTAKAFPPKDSVPPFNLPSGKNVRLYCHWVSERVVILFNGGLKTHNEAQKCPNVADHFYNAVNWSGKLNALDIQTNGQDIINLGQLKIKY
jgi:hypothetical protein